MSNYLRETLTSRDDSVKMMSLEFSAFGWSRELIFNLTCSGLKKTNSSGVFSDVNRIWAHASVLALSFPLGSNRLANLVARSFLGSSFWLWSFLILKYNAALIITWEKIEHLKWFWYNFPPVYKHCISFVKEYWGCKRLSLLWDFKIT